METTDGSAPDGSFEGQNGYPEHDGYSEHNGYTEHNFEELNMYRQGLLRRYREIGPEIAGLVEGAAGQEGPARTVSHLRDMLVTVFVPMIAGMLGPPDRGDGSVATGAAPGSETAREAAGEIQAIYREIIGRLEQAPRKAWSRSARHPNAGVRTLQWWVEASLFTAEQHLQQLKEEMER